MAYRKRPNCPECGKMVRYPYSIGNWEFGEAGEPTLVFKVRHSECYIKVKQPTPAEISAINANIELLKAAR